MAKPTLKDLQKLLDEVRHKRVSREEVPPQLIRKLKKMYKELEAELEDAQEEVAIRHEYEAELAYAALQEQELLELEEEEETDYLSKPKPEAQVLPMAGTEDLMLEGMNILITTLDKSVKPILHEGPALMKKISELSENPLYAPLVTELFGKHPPEFAQRMQVGTNPKNGDPIFLLPAADIPAFTEYFKGKDFQVNQSSALIKTLGMTPTPTPGTRKMREEEEEKSMPHSSFGHLGETPKLTRE